MTVAPLTIDRLNVHQVTINQCGFRESIECLSRNGITRTAVWRDKLREVGVDEAVRILADSGVACSSYCYGGLLTEADHDRVLSDNRRWIEEAARLGARSIVMITGGLPPGSRDLEAMRGATLDRLAALVPDARAAGVRLAIEPLHPMVCGFRSIISTIDEGLRMIAELDADKVVGLAFDTYAVWWEADLQAKIERAAPYVTNLHVSDWLKETADVRVDRGMPGDGLIDNRKLRGWFEQAGFSGAVEVEILSARNWWKQPPDTVLRTIIGRMPRHL